MADYQTSGNATAAGGQTRPRSVQTGVSRKSSMASRNSQLIKKNTGECGQAYDRLAGLGT